MMTRDAYRDPIYNLKAVVAETGITADALRAWERRYGLPRPGRTEAGHRVYSRRDIDVIKWLVARQEEGLRIGRAVKLWYSLEEEGHDPLQRLPPQPKATRRPVGDRLIDLREEWVSACLSFDESRAQRALSQASAVHSAESVLSQVIREGIAELGRGWYEEDITVQQEHFASRLATRQIDTLLQATPPPTRRGHILIACPPQEVHTIGPLMLELLLRRAGWDVIFLGGNVPIEEIEETIEATKPQLLILAAQQLHTAASLLDMSQAIEQDGPSLAFGGAIFNRVPALQQRIPGHFLGETLEEAVRETESLMMSARRGPSFERRSEEYQQILSCCLDGLQAVEASVWTSLESVGLRDDGLREFNSGFVQAVISALKLGDIGFVSDYLDWLEGVGSHGKVPTENLPRYLAAYRQAAEEQLGERGALIVEWLDKQLSEGRT